MLRWLQFQASRSAATVARAPFRVVAAFGTAHIVSYHVSSRRRHSVQTAVQQQPATMLPLLTVLPQSSQLVLVAAVILVGSLLTRWISSCLITLNRECLNSESALFFMDPSRMSKVPLPCIHTEASKTLSVVFPAYNEATRLPAALDEALEYLRERRRRQGTSFSYEIIIVDDGSKDDTFNVAMEYVKQHGLDTVRALRLLVNKGKGAAVRAGMLAARGQIMLFADSDGATQFSDIDRLEESLRSIASSPQSSEGSVSSCGIENQHAMVVGSRAHLEKLDVVAKRHWMRNIMMHGFHFLVVLVAGNAVRDTQCGFKNLRLQRWCFDVELVYLASKLKIPIAEENVNWVEIAGSKIRAWSIISMAFELFLISAAYRSGAWPIVAEHSMA